VRTAALRVARRVSWNAGYDGALPRGAAGRWSGAVRPACDLVPPTRPDDGLS